jgi:hypothetical protein
MQPVWYRRIILGLIFIGVVIAGFFGLRALFALREFRSQGGPPPTLNEAFDKPPKETMETDVELIRDWMTVPYISKLYRVNPKLIFDALGISLKDNNEEKSLLQLNEEFFPETPGIVIELVKAVIQAHQTVPTVVSPDAPAPPTAP